MKSALRWVIIIFLLTLIGGYAVRFGYRFQSRLYYSSASYSKAYNAARDDIGLPVSHMPLSTPTASDKLRALFLPHFKADAIAANGAILAQKETTTEYVYDTVFISPSREIKSLGTNRYSLSWNGKILNLTEEPLSERKLSIDGVVQKNLKLPTTVKGSIDSGHLDVISTKDLIAFPSTSSSLDDGFLNIVSSTTGVSRVKGKFETKRSPIVEALETAALVEADEFSLLSSHLALSENDLFGMASGNLSAYVGKENNHCVPGRIRNGVFEYLPGTFGRKFNTAMTASRGGKVALHEFEITTAFAKPIIFENEKLREVPLADGMYHASITGLNDKGDLLMYQGSSKTYSHFLLRKDNKLFNFADLLDIRQFDDHSKVVKCVKPVSILGLPHNQNPMFCDSKIVLNVYLNDTHGILFVDLN